MRKNRGIAPAVIIVAVAVILIGGYVAIKDNKGKQIADLQKEINDVKEEINKNEEKETVKPKPQPIKLALSKIIPVAGSLEQTVTLTGTGFTATGNTVYFAPRLIENLASTDGKTLVFNLKDAQYEIPACAKSPTAPCATIAPKPLVSGDILSITVRNKNGESNAVKYLVQSSITVLSPNGSERVLQNSIQSIRWKSDALVRNVKIMLVEYEQACSAGFTCVRQFPRTYDITSGFISNAGLYDWRVSDTIPNGKYVISIKDDTGLHADQSDAPFTITKAGTPEISSISPVSGKVGSKVVIYGSNVRNIGHIHFGQGIIKAFSPTETSVEFVVPGGHYLECFDANPACLAPVMPVEAGEYEILVSNSIGDSNSLMFKVVK